MKVVAGRGGDDGQRVPVQLVQQVGHQEGKEDVKRVHAGAHDHVDEPIARDAGAVVVQEPHNSIVRPLAVPLYGFLLLPR